jgi:hypothetical protein
LAPRSVRDLIYSGRLPSLRIGRLHYVRSSDLEHERRRRLGLPLPRRRAAAGTRPRRVTPRSGPRPHAEQRPHADPAGRRQRAAERAALVSRWAARHHADEPRVPFAVVSVSEPTTCAACGREVRQGRMVESTEGAPARLCLQCGRRAILDWADRRRLESATARRLAHELRSVAVETESAAPETTPAPRAA